MASLGGIVGSPLMQLLASLFSSSLQNQSQQQYEGDVDQQIADAMRVAERAGPASLAAFDASSGQALNQLRNTRDSQRRNASSLIRSAMRNRNQFLGDFEERGDELARGYGAGLDSFLSSLSGQNAETVQGYKDRYANAERDIEGYGEQQKTDIDTGYRNKEAAITQDLISRGLSPTSVSAVAKTVNETERSAEQRRLGEDLTRNRVNLLSALSGDTLAAQERGNAQSNQYQFGGMNTAFGARQALDSSQAQYDAALRGDIQAARGYAADSDAANSNNLANFFATRGSNRANLTDSGYQTLLNAIMGINRVPPPQNQLPFQFGQNSVQAPSAPSMWNSVAGGAAPGIGTGLGVGLLGLLSGGAGFAAVPGMGLLAASDRNLKTEFRDVDHASSLAAVKDLPVEKWQYKGEPTDHVGPMAQDFKEAFGLGDGRTINMIDAVGVLFSAIKGMADEIASLKARLA